VKLTYLVEYLFTELLNKVQKKDIVPKCNTSSRVCRVKLSPLCSSEGQRLSL